VGGVCVLCDCVIVVILGGSWMELWDIIAWGVFVCGVTVLLWSYLAGW
jgi:hypothetical protein